MDKSHLKPEPDSLKINKLVNYGKIVFKFYYMGCFMQENGSKIVFQPAFGCAQHPKAGQKYTTIIHFPPEFLPVSEPLTH